MQDNADEDKTLDEIIKLLEEANEAADKVDNNLNNLIFNTILLAGTYFGIKEFYKFIKVLKLIEKSSVYYESGYNYFSYLFKAKSNNSQLAIFYPNTNKKSSIIKAIYTKLYSFFTTTNKSKITLKEALEIFNKFMYSPEIIEEGDFMQL